MLKEEEGEAENANGDAPGQFDFEEENHRDENSR